MSDTNILSSEEIELLEAFDRGIDPSEIAKKLNLSEIEVRSKIDIAIKKREYLRTIAKERGREIPAHIRVVDGRLNQTQKGTMKIGSQILKQLSEGIYTSPASSLKELIGNSFDSDAPEVTISISENEVSIRDTGSGMDWKDFDAEFTFISYSTKRLKGDITPIYHRPIIGFIGIGFVAVSELCDILEIRSCKKNSDLVFEAKIDFSKYRLPEMVDKEFYEVSEYELTNYKKEDKHIELEESFTEIKLRNLRPGFREIIRDKELFGEGETSIQTIWKHVYEEGIGITGLSKYWQMILNLALICPVVYSDEGPVIGISDEIVSEIKSTLQSFKFRVTINGIELVKPIAFPSNSSIAESKAYAIHPIKESIKTSEGTLSFRGYIYSQHQIIDPKECMGILIRIKNVAVGGYDRTLLDYPSGTNQLFRNWISGEIYVDDGLEKAMNITRSSFKTTNPDYIALREWLYRFLNEKVFKYTYEQYYVGGKMERQAEKEAEYMRVFEKIVKSEMGSKYKFEYGALPVEDSVIIDKKKETLVVNTEYPVFRQAHARFENILQRIFVLFEIAVEKSKGDIQKLERIFKEEIEKWINE